MELERIQAGHDRCNTPLCIIRIGFGLLLLRNDADGPETGHLEGIRKARNTAAHNEEIKVVYHVSSGVPQAWSGTKMATPQDRLLHKSWN
jgi:hypothetical protein